jgi:hypothetical protein
MIQLKLNQTKQEKRIIEFFDTVKKKKVAEKIALLKRERDYIFNI